MQDDLCCQEKMFDSNDEDCQVKTNGFSCETRGDVFSANQLFTKNNLHDEAVLHYQKFTRPSCDLSLTQLETKLLLMLLFATNEDEIKADMFRKIGKDFAGGKLLVSDFKRLMLDNVLFSIPVEDCCGRQLSEKDFIDLLTIIRKKQLKLWNKGKYSICSICIKYIYSMKKASREKMDMKNCELDDLYEIDGKKRRQLDNEISNDILNSNDGSRRLSCPFKRNSSSDKSEIVDNLILSSDNAQSYSPRSPQEQLSQQQKEQQQQDDQCSNDNGNDHKFVNLECSIVDKSKKRKRLKDDESLVDDACSSTKKKKSRKTTTEDYQSSAAAAAVKKKKLKETQVFFTEVDT